MDSIKKYQLSGDRRKATEKTVNGQGGKIHSDIRNTLRYISDIVVDHIWGKTA